MIERVESSRFQKASNITGVILLLAMGVAAFFQFSDTSIEFMFRSEVGKNNWPFHWTGFELIEAQIQPSGKDNVPDILYLEVQTIHQEDCIYLVAEIGSPAKIDLCPDDGKSVHYIALTESIDDLTEGMGVKLCSQNVCSNSIPISKGSTEVVVDLHSVKIGHPMIVFADRFYVDYNCGPGADEAYFEHRNAYGMPSGQIDFDSPSKIGWQEFSIFCRFGELEHEEKFKVFFIR